MMITTGVRRDRNPLDGTTAAAVMKWKRINTHDVCVYLSGKLVTYNSGQGHSS